MDHPIAWEHRATKQMQRAFFTLNSGWCLHLPYGLCSFFIENVSPDHIVKPGCQVAREEGHTEMPHGR